MYKIVSTIFSLLLSFAVCGQKISGLTVDEKSNMPVKYVSVGIKGTTIGTISDNNGRYSIELNQIMENDTIAFSCIGYESVLMKVSDLMAVENKNIFLKAKAHQLDEVVISSKEYIQKTLGVKNTSSIICSGFQDNFLGYELGILMHAKKPAKIKKVNFHIAFCSYDTIFYRLNVYRKNGKMNFENILQYPVYIALSKDSVNNKITVDLEKEDIKVSGDFLVTLENVKDLGYGYLYFYAIPFRSTYYRRTMQDQWHKKFVGVSISADVDMEK